MHARVPGFVMDEVFLCAHAMGILVARWDGRDVHTTRNIVPSLPCTHIFNLIAFPVPSDQRWTVGLSYCPTGIVCPPQKRARPSGIIRLNDEIGDNRGIYRV